MATVKTSLDFSITAKYAGTAAMEAARKDFQKTRDELRAMAKEGINIRVGLNGLAEDRAEIAALTNKVHDVHLRVVATGLADAEEAINRIARPRTVKIVAVADVAQAEEDIRNATRTRVGLIEYRGDATEATEAVKEAARTQTAHVVAEADGVAAAKAKLDELSRPRVATVTTAIAIDNDSQKQLNALKAAYDKAVNEIRAGRDEQIREIRHKLANDKLAVPDAFGKAKYTAAGQRAIAQKRLDLNGEAQQVIESIKADAARQIAMAKDLARSGGLDISTDKKTAQADLKARTAAERQYDKQRQDAAKQAQREFDKARDLSNAAQERAAKSQLRNQAIGIKDEIGDLMKGHVLKLDVDKARAKAEIDAAFPRKRTVEIQAIITRGKQDLDSADREHKAQLGQIQRSADRGIGRALDARDQTVSAGGNRALADRDARNEITRIRAEADTAAAQAQLDHLKRQQNVVVKAQADIAEAKAKLDSLRKPIDVKANKGAIDAITSAAGKAKTSVTELAAAMALVSVGAGALGAVALTGLAGGVIAAGGAAMAINQKLTVSHREAMDAAKMQAEQAKRDVIEANREIATTAIESGQKQAAAQHDVAIAQRDVADTAIESGQRIAAAQHEVAMADRGEEDARRSLTDAYRDARHELEDLQLQLEAAPVNERGAELRLRRARQNMMDLYKSGRPVTVLDIQEHQQAIDEAQVGLDEVRERNRQLQDDAAVAAQRGVEGNEKVIKGKEGLADATYQAQISQQNLANTQRQTSEQMADAAYREHIAQQNLANTQRETAAAQQKAAENLTVALAEQARANSELAKAAHQANTAMTQLSAMFADLAAPLKGPLHDAMESFKKQFMDLKPVIQIGFQSAADDVQPFTDALTGLMLGPVPGVTSALAKSQPTVLGFRDGMRTLGLDIGTMFDKMSNGAEGFGDMWRILGTQLGTFLIQIGDFAGRYAGPASQALGSLLDGVNKLAAGFLNGLGPVMQNLPDIAGRINIAMGDVGNILQQVVPALGRLVTALVDGLGQAFHTLSGPLATTLVNILDSLTGIVVGLSGPVNDLAKAFGAVLDFLGPLVPLITPLVVGFAAFQYIGKPVYGALQSIKEQGTGVLGIFGNPWVTGFAVATGAVLAFTESAGKGAAAVQRLKDNTQALLDARYEADKALEQSGGALNDSVINGQAQILDQYRQQMKTSANDTPGFLDKGVAGLGAIGQKLFGAGGGIANDEGIREEANTHAKAVRDAFSDLGLNSEQIVKIYTGSKKDYDAMIDRLKGMGDGGKEAATELGRLRGEWALDSVSVSPVTAAMKDLADKNKDAQSAISAATDALEKQRQGGLTLENAQLKLNEAISGLSTNAQSASGAMVDANGVIDTTSQKGQALYNLLNQQLAPAWETLTTAVYRDAIQHGQTADQAQAAAQRASDGVRDSAMRQIQAMGYTQEQAQHLLDHYNQLSGNFKAVMTLNADQASGELDKLQTKLDLIMKKLDGDIPDYMQIIAAGAGLGPDYHPNIPQGVPNVPAAPKPGVAPAIPSGAATPDNMLPQLLGKTPGHARGGLISGDGTDTSDSILSFLSRDEFVTRAAMVRKYGLGFFQALNAGAINPATLPRFATGGAVGGATAATGPVSDSQVIQLLPMQLTQMQDTISQLARQLPAEFQKMYDAIESGTTKAQDKIGTDWTDSTNAWKDTVGNKFTGDTGKLWEKFWSDSHDTAKTQQEKIGTEWADSILHWSGLIDTQVISGLGGQWTTFWNQTNDTAKQQQDRINSGFRDNLATGLRNSTVGLVADVNTEWSKIEGVFARPVNAIIGVWNQSVVGAVPGLQPMTPIPGFANGGQPDGSPGYINGMGGSREDKHVVAVSNREYIVNAEATSRNRAVLDAINFGGERAVVPAYGLGGMTMAHEAPEVPGFSLGGIAFRHLRKAAGLHFADGGATDGSSQAAVTRALSWASALSGQPYNAEGWLDCSGFISGVYDMLLGRSPHREFTTVDNFRALGFVPGRGGIMDIGVTPLPGNSGHMAATLAGHRLESGGSHGNIMVDGSAVGADSGQFSDHYYLPGELFSPPYTGPGSNGEGGPSGSFVGMLGGAVTALGTGVQNLFSSMFQQMTDPILSGIPDVQGAGAFPKAMATKVRDALIGGIKGQEATMLLGGTIPQGMHKEIIDKALALTNTPPPGSIEEWERGLETLITRESNWNTSAINNWDSNAAAGNPSKGLAQTTGTTFDAYKVAGHDNIYEGVDNVAAAINYIKARYGSISNVQQANANMPPAGYANGTNNAKKGWAFVGEKGVELVNFAGGETVIPHELVQKLPLQDNNAMQQFGFGPGQQNQTPGSATPPFDPAQLAAQSQLQANAAGLNFLQTSAEENFRGATGQSLFNSDGFIPAIFKTVPGYMLNLMQWQQSGQLGRPYSALSNAIGSQLAAPPTNPLDPGQQGVPTNPQGQGPTSINPNIPGQLRTDLLNEQKNPADPGQQGVPVAPQGQPPTNVDPLHPALRPVDVHFHVADMQDALRQWRQHQREQSLGFDPFGDL
jgi:SLT domain-containing protein